MRLESGARRQRLGLWACVALVIGNSIGGGVFLLPASLAPYGLNSLIAWALAACGAILLALMYVQLSRAHPDAGGPYAYTHEAFGPLIAFLVAWGYWVSIWVGNAAIAVGAVSYLMSLLPWIGTVRGAPLVLTLSILWSLTWVNCYGIKAAGWVQSVTTVLKVLPLIAVAAAAPFVLRRHDLAATAATAPLSFGAVTTAATMVLFALLGLESATVPADKVRDPARTIPAATWIGAVATALLCAAASGAVLLLEPAAVLARSNAPFADLAGALWGGWSAPLVSAFAAVSAIGALNGWILLQGELPYAMARNHAFPQFFARESARGTPVRALLFGSALVSALLLMNDRGSMVDVFTFMILLSTSACVVMYGVCALALLRLTWTGRMAGARLRRGPLTALGIAATIYSLWAIAGAGRAANLWGCALFVAGLPLYYRVRSRSAR
ncbi:MAG TPA: amino acid permease [Steroidobacteraceae bacterium]|nr:amino acid permease [Steroidobacteraceae bacterium]